MRTSVTPQLQMMYVLERLNQRRLQHGITSKELAVISPFSPFMDTPEEPQIVVEGLARSLGLRQRVVNDEFIEYVELSLVAKLDGGMFKMFPPIRETLAQIAMAELSTNTIDYLRARARPVINYMVAVTLRMPNPCVYTDNFPRHLY